MGGGKEVLDQNVRRRVLGGSLAPGARLEFHVGWSGWTRPPTMAGGGGGCPAKSGLQQGKVGAG